MIKKYTFWLYTSSVLQILTGLIHSLSFINKPQPTNDTEKELLNLMTSYKMDLGAGFTPTMSDLMTSFSICLMLLLLLGGSMNWFLLRKNPGIEIMRGVILINLIVFGICFVAMFILTFLPPVILAGLIFISLLLAYLTLPRKLVY